MLLPELHLSRSVAVTTAKGLFGAVAPVAAWSWTAALETWLHIAALFAGIGVSCVTFYSILRDIQRKDRREIDHANRMDRRAMEEAMWLAKRRDKAKQRRRAG